MLVDVGAGLKLVLLKFALTRLSVPLPEVVTNVLSVPLTIKAGSMLFVTANELGRVVSVIFSSPPNVLAVLICNVPLKARVRAAVPLPRFRVVVLLTVLRKTFRLLPPEIVIVSIVSDELADALPRTSSVALPSVIPTVSNHRPLVPGPVKAVELSNRTVPPFLTATLVALALPAGLTSDPLAPPKINVPKTVAMPPPSGVLVLPLVTWIVPPELMTVPADELLLPPKTSVPSLTVVKPE